MEDSFTFNNTSVVNSTYYDDLYYDSSMDSCQLNAMEPYRDYTQVGWVSAIITFAYVLVATLALLGNLLVIWTVWRNSHMHTVTNYYIMNLAISDLLVAALVMPLKLLEYRAECQWHIFKSDGLCSVVYYLLPVFVFASVLTLVAISIERYYAIVHPLSAMKVSSKSRTRKILAVTWVIPILVASPFVFSRSLPFSIHSELGSISREICNDRFNEIDFALFGDPEHIGDFRKGYFLFLFFVMYLTPSAVIFITCVKIAISLVQPITVENSIYGRKDTRRRHEENKRKVARMVIVIAITFIISWSPHYLVSIISQLQPNSFLREGQIIFTMLITHLCGFVNSCLNPIIYTAMSQKFRRSFKDILGRILYCCTFRSLGPYGMRYGQSQRFTSTFRQTLSETDPNHLALNDHRHRNTVLLTAKTHPSHSSSGTDSDIRELKEEEKSIVK
ncbi:NPFF2-like protein, partial [Mya arenaria]